MNRALRTALWGGAAAGFGLSGMVDAAIFHNILQWHHLIVTDDMAANLRADGWLMIALWLSTAAGVLLLWRAARAARDEPAGRMAWGGAFLGAAAFNGGDVILDHFLLELHRLNMGVDSFLPDLAWLGLSALMLMAGIVLVRDASRRASAPTGRPART